MAAIAEACSEATRGDQREPIGIGMLVQVASVDEDGSGPLHQAVRIECPKSDLSTEPKLMAGTVLDM